MKNITISILILVLVSCGKNQKEPKIELTNDNSVEVIKFTPEYAVEVTFDELFKSFEVIELNKPEESKLPPKVFRSDSFLVISWSKYYSVYDLKGKFITNTGSAGEGPNSNITLAYCYVNNESILSICDTKWIRFGIKENILSKGCLPHSVTTSSFIPLNDKTWLFYVPLIYRHRDTLRLWTTDQNFRLKKQYLFHERNAPSGGLGFLKFIHETTNGIFITDRTIDTIYKFMESGIKPVYFLSFGNYKFRRQLEMRKLEFNEASCLFKIVSSNAVLFKINMNDKYYFIYHDRLNHITRTISKITDGPDLINSAEIVGSDKNDRLYWQLSTKYGSLIDQSAIKYGYASLMNKNQIKGTEANPFLLVTTIR